MCARRTKRDRRYGRKVRAEERYEEDYEDEVGNPHQLRRNKRDGVLGGVCAGLADYFGLEIWQTRALFILSLIFFHVSAIIYVILWIILPKARVVVSERRDREEEAFWREVSLKPSVTFGRLKYAFRDLEDRLAAMEREVTSKDYQLRKAFREIEQ